MFTVRDLDPVPEVQLKLIPYRDGVKLMAFNAAGIAIRLLEFTKEGVHANNSANVSWLIAEGLKFDEKGRLIVGR